MFDQWLNEQNAFIFRILHVDNLEYILQNGLNCRNCQPLDPNFRAIGNSDIIIKRDDRKVPLSPHGFLSDYVPFYFAPRSPMLGSIYKKSPTSQEDIIYICSKYDIIDSNGLNFVFTDGQAMMSFSEYFNQRSDLSTLDWGLFRSKYWNNTVEDNDRMRRRLAEFLVYQHVPISCIISIVVKNELTREHVQNILDTNGIEIDLRVNADFYY